MSRVTFSYLLWNTLWACSLYFGLYKDVGWLYPIIWFITYIYLVTSVVLSTALKITEYEGRDKIVAYAVKIRNNSFTSTHFRRQLDVGFDLFCLILMLATGHYFLMIATAACVYFQQAFYDETDKLRK